MSLLLGVLLSMAAQEPAPAEPRPVVRRGFIKTESKPVRFAREAAPALPPYFACLTGQARGGPWPDVVKTFEMHIASCVEARAKAAEHADRLLKAAGWSKERREASIAETLSDIDEAHRDQARQLRDFFAERGIVPPTSDKNESEEETDAPN